MQRPPRGGQISTGKIPITGPGVLYEKFRFQTGGVSYAKIGVQTVWSVFYKNIGQSSYKISVILVDKYRSLW